MNASKSAHELMPGPIVAEIAVNEPCGLEDFLTRRGGIEVSSTFKQTCAALVLLLSSLALPGASVPTSAAVPAFVAIESLGVEGVDPYNFPSAGDVTGDGIDDLVQWVIAPAPALMNSRIAVRNGSPSGQLGLPVITNLPALTRGPGEIDLGGLSIPPLGGHLV